MIIRTATLADVPAIVELSSHFLLATPYGQVLPVEPEYLEHCASTVIEGTGVIFLADAGERPVGFLAAYLGRHPFTGQVYVEELAWWMEPTARKGTAGPRMLWLLIEWARQSGAVVLKMVAPAGSDVGDFYLRHGFTHLESAFLKIL